MYIDDRLFCYLKALVVCLTDLFKAFHWKAKFPLAGVPTKGGAKFSIPTVYKATHPLVLKAETKYPTRVSCGALINIGNQNPDWS